MRVDDSIPPALTISFAFPRAPPPAIKPNRNRRCRAAGRIRPELWPGGAADFCLGIRFWEFDFDRIGRVNARSAVYRARGGAERCRCLFWEFFWEFCFGNSLLTGSVGGAGVAAKLSSRLAKTQWRDILLSRSCSLCASPRVRRRRGNCRRRSLQRWNGGACSRGWRAGGRRGAAWLWARRSSGARCPASGRKHGRLSRRRWQRSG